MNNFKTSAVILAGGNGSRMMSDKTAFTSWQYIKAVCTGTSASAVPYSPLYYVYGKDHGS